MALQRLKAAEKHTPREDVYHQVTSSPAPSASSRLTITADVTSAAGGSFWVQKLTPPLSRIGELENEAGTRMEEQGAGNEDGGGEMDEEMAVARQHFLRMSKEGVEPTRAPCSSPVHFALPTLQLPGRCATERRRKKKTSTKPPKKIKNTHASVAAVLRDLDPRVKFYVTAENASDCVTSGRVYHVRSATPVWNRALLLGSRTGDTGTVFAGFRGAAFSSGGNSPSGSAGSDRLFRHQNHFSPSSQAKAEHRGGTFSRHTFNNNNNNSNHNTTDVEIHHSNHSTKKRDGEDGEVVKLTLDVVKIHGQNHESRANLGLSPYALTLIQDHAPGMDLTIIQQRSKGATSNPERVDQSARGSGRSQGGSASYGSAGKCLLRSSGEATHLPQEGGGDTHHHHQGEQVPSSQSSSAAVHPFLRMYQTRPGAFARLLSREADLKAARIAPGSTIASLMDPHPALAGEREGEGEEGTAEFEECVLQGTTIDMTNQRTRRKHRSRFVLPPLAFYPTDWPKRQPRRSTKPRPAHKDDNSDDDDETDDTDDEDSMDREHSSGKERRGRSRTKTKIPKAGLHMMCEFPKQFVLSAHEDDAVLDLDKSLSDTEIVDWRSDRPRVPEELRRLDREIASFTDMDYVLPSHLNELLLEEGVDEKAVDRTMAVGKVWHNRALYLNHVYHIKRRKFLARPGRFSSLPPIGKSGGTKGGKSPDDQAQPTSASDVDARRERRANRTRPWELPEALAPEPPPSAGRLPPTPPPNATTTTTTKPKPRDDVAEACRVREELEQVRTDVDRLRWESQRTLEVSSLPPDFVHPRLVIISSRVPRCQSMSKAIRRGDNSILYIVYDFDTCTFDDLLATAAAQLDQYHPGCKAKSALFMCQGAEGCLYMFRKIVLTPQKMKRVQYQQIKEFWKSLGQLISKTDVGESFIHLLGGSLDNPQGRALLYEIQKAMLPNLSLVTTVKESTEAGREAVELYFDFRKFLLWRAKDDSRNSLDYTDITRSWSSLADEADEMDAR